MEDKAVIAAIKLISSEFTITQIPLDRDVIVKAGAMMPLL